MTGLGDCSILLNSTCPGVPLRRCLVALLPSLAMVGVSAGHEQDACTGDDDHFDLRLARHSSSAPFRSSVVCVSNELAGGWLMVMIAVRSSMARFTFDTRP